MKRLAEDLQLGVEAAVLQGGVLVLGGLALGPSGRSGGVGGGDGCAFALDLCR